MDICVAMEDVAISHDRLLGEKTNSVKGNGREEIRQPPVTIRVGPRIVMGWLSGLKFCLCRHRIDQNSRRYSS